MPTATRPRRTPADARPRRFLFPRSRGCRAAAAPLPAPGPPFRAPPACCPRMTRPGGSVVSPLAVDLV